MSCALKASSAEVWLTEQALEGQVDANPVFDKVRRTDGRVTQQNTFEKSAELKSNLQGQKNTLTDVGYNNTFSVEVTQNIMLFAKSVLMNNTEDPIDKESTAVAFDSVLNQITDPTLDAFINVVIGQWIFVKGSNKEALNIPYYVLGKPDNNTLEVVNVPVDGAAGDNIGISGVMLRSGNTPQLLTIQGRDDHTGATDDTDYKTQIDAVVDVLNLAVPQTGLLTGSSTIIAATQLPDLEPIAGQTDAPIDDSNVLGAAMDFAGFYPNQTAKENNFADVTIDIIRNTGVQSVAGKLGAKCVAQDVIGITGTLTSLRRAVDPAAEEGKYDNSERFSMSFGFVWEDGKYLMITMRQMVYTDGSIASATGEFANFAGTYDAEQDEFETTIQFDTNITIDDYIAPAGVIEVPAGTDVIPAVAGFTGDFITGTAIDIQGTTDGVQPAWGWQGTLTQDYTTTEFAEALAEFLQGNDGITFSANGNDVEALGILGTTAVTIDVLVVTPAP